MLGRNGHLQSSPAVADGGVFLAKTNAGKEFRPGKPVLESEPLCHGKRPPRSAKQPLAGPIEPQSATVKYQEAVKSDHDGLVQISRRTAGIEVRTYGIGRCIRRRFASIKAKAIRSTR
jgi:hypothetical protein